MSTPHGSGHGPNPEHARVIGEAKHLNADQVLQELQQNGISDLQGLVHARLAEIQTLDPNVTQEAGSVLVFRCFILADWS